MTTSIPVLIYFSSLKKLVKMRELFEGTAKIAILNFSKKPLFMRCSADKCSPSINGFRVSPVMTTSIPVLIYFSSLKKLVKMRELFEGTAKIAILNFSKKPLFMRCSADKCSPSINGFRVRPVMTASILLQKYLNILP